MKRNIFLVLIGVLVTLSFTACSSLTVNSDYDKTVDFTKFKTYSYYGWADNSDQLLTRFDKERIEKAFGSEFAKRNLTYTESGGDLIVTLHIVTEQKEQTTATTTSMGMAGGYGGYYGYGPGYGYGGGMSTTNYNTYEYTVGTLVVDVYDAAKKELIFESIGSGTVSEKPESREKSIPIAVSAIMKTYPVKPISGK